MSKALISIDLLELGKYKLNINEYLNILKIQHNLLNSTLPFVIDERFIPRLILDQFIEQTDSGVYILGSTGNKMLNGEDDGDLFEEFYALFPNKVDTGFGYRPVSTLDPNSVSGKTTRAIWNRIAKGKPSLQKTIITNLKKELAHKKASGSMAYLQNIDTWLRQATWEKWEDIPDKEESSGFKQL